MKKFIAIMMALVMMMAIAVPAFAAELNATTQSGNSTVLVDGVNDKGDGTFDDGDVLVNSDGRSYYVPAGTGVELKPGESITLWPHQYHDFDVVGGTGDVLIGEVSMCNDDNTDNRFYEPVGRFPEIEEDEEPYRLLCNEYPQA